MTKFVTTLLIAMLAGLLVYSARRRVWLALKTAGIVYIILLPLRLLFSAGTVFEQLDELVWPALGILVVWVVLWWASTTYERRKRERQRQAR
jgi:hypothetical protein